VQKGDATVMPTGDKWLACCDADQCGSSWLGPERDTFDEATEDPVTHLVRMPSESSGVP